MLALVAKYPHPVHKLLRVARHRVIRWFRPTRAELRRQCAAAEPHPTMMSPLSNPKMENRYDDHA